MTNKENTVYLNFTFSKGISPEIASKVKSLTRFYTDKIGSRTNDSFFVNVKIRKNGYGLEGNDGLAWKSMDYEYEILVDGRLPEKSLLRTLQHELIHVKQYVLKELKDTNKAGIHFWKDQKVRVSDYSNPCFDTPWEKQAFSCETRYMNEWLNSGEYKCS